MKIKVYEDEGFIYALCVCVYSWNYNCEQPDQVLGTQLQSSEDQQAIYAWLQDKLPLVLRAPVTTPTPPPCV